MWMATAEIGAQFIVVVLLLLIGISCDKMTPTTALRRAKLMNPLPV